MEPATVVKTEEKFQLTERVNRISVSPTMVVLQAAEQLKSQGVDVADFGPGEPDFPYARPHQASRHQGHRRK